MLTPEEIQTYIGALPPYIYQYVSNIQPFVFLDFEVFEYDWMVCFSVDGIHVKAIVNDLDKLKDLFLNKLKNRILIAYNGLRYDKAIMLAGLNNLNLKMISDEAINTFEYFITRYHKNEIQMGTDLMWYDPMTRLDGSLKTYEACEGENIYESDVDFNIKRPLTPQEIEETIKYCSFDVQMLIKYFFTRNYDTFLGHVHLIELTLKARPQLQFHNLISKTDSALIGLYLCSEKIPDTTKDSDTITLPSNIHLGKYKKQVEDFLSIPINTLRQGRYNDLNSWTVKSINKSLAACEDSSEIDALHNKKQKQVDKIKKLKTKLQDLKQKTTLTVKQATVVEELPCQIEQCQQVITQLNEQISQAQQKYNQLQQLKDELSNYPEDSYQYRKTLGKIVNAARVTNKSNLLDLVIDFLSLDDDELYEIKYKVDKTTSRYNKILVTKPFETILTIKGIPHHFKTGGLHSVFDKPLHFTPETDKGQVLLIADVGSLYPSLMIVFGLCSRAMDDPSFYAQLKIERIQFKKAGDTVKAGTYKLIINRTYGSMGSESNLLYDPTNRLKVCIYGQSCIVDLLDKLEDNVATLKLYQSNTDGIIISCDESEYDIAVQTIHEWEKRTGLEMEIDECTELHQRDVSSYILVKK